MSGSPQSITWEWLLQGRVIKAKINDHHNCNMIHVLICYKFNLSLYSGTISGRCGVGLSLAVISFANTTTIIGTGNFFSFLFQL